MKALFGLQIADIATTLVFRSMGVAETNPLVGGLMVRFGTLGGLVLVKIAAIAIALLCGVAAHPKFVKKINWVYCAIVTINLLTIFATMYHQSA